MNLKAVVIFLIFALSGPLQAQQSQTDPDVLMRNGKFADAATVYAIGIQQSSAKGDSKAVADACIGLYKVLWLQQAQDKLAHLFKPCSMETMDWLNGKIDRELQPIYRPNRFPPEMISLANGRPVKLDVRLDIDASGKPTKVQIVSGLKLIAGPKDYRNLEKMVTQQLMAWRWLPRIQAGKPVELKDVPIQFTYSLE